MSTGLLTAGLAAEAPSSSSVHDIMPSEPSVATLFVWKSELLLSAYILAARNVRTFSSFIRRTRRALDIPSTFSFTGDTRNSAIWTLLGTIERQRSFLAVFYPERVTQV